MPDNNYLQTRHLYGKYIIREWNTNGFNSISKPYNTTFKKEVICNLYSDFWIIPETHCRDDECIEIDKFKIFQNNRKVNDNNRRGSGGIAIAVSNSVLETHSVVNISKGIDGQLAIKLKNTLNDSVVGVVGLYLSPDSYLYGQDPENFFNEASVIWEDMSDCDLLVGAGDLNARTKEIVDYLPDIDGNLPHRSNPDNVKNSHGNYFINFLKENRAVILNGRITPELNDYTFVSTRGSSVPDYIFCPLDHHYYCTEMKTTLVRDLVNSMAIPPPPSLPDHSILSGTFISSHFKFSQTENCSFEPFNKDPEIENKKKRKNLKKVNDTFFMSEETRLLVVDTIARLENQIENQGEINRLWKEIKQLFLNEMEKLPDIPTSNSKKNEEKFQKITTFLER